MIKCMVTALASVALATQSRQNMRAAPSLEKSLRLYCTEQAYIRAIPASNVYGDKLMSQIACARPSTLKQLMTIKGIGTARLENYGKDIVRMVNLSNRKSRSMPPKLPKISLGQEKQPRKKASFPRPRPKLYPRQKSKARVCNYTPPNKKVSNVTALASVPATSVPTSVYILELEGGRVYVGSSKNVTRRISQHNAGTGSAFTRLYKPTGVLLPRLGNVFGDGDAAERDETLRYMFLRGIPLVRGWKFTQVIMPFSDFDEAESNIRELFDLCRCCGRPGHFMSQCTATVDRWGRECKRSFNKP
jgi:predicted GIY-YIG superfamily endonuclease